jgi:rhamnosyltransferase
MISVIIPTYNAVVHLPALLDMLKKQTLANEVVIIDSGSTDGTTELLNKRKIPFTAIPKSEFNHGGTRNLGVKLASCEDVVMLTQDALLTNKHALANLVAMMHSKPEIGMAYGRQLAYPEATLMSEYARLTNYPPVSNIRSKSDISRLGIRTCHCSNSFASYRKSALASVGGFPTDTILGEDVVVAARLIQSGRSLAYCADAQVYHSHNYEIMEEFRRYFDIGAFHQQQRTLLREFQRAESEGVKYVLDEWRYLKNRRTLSLIPTQLVRTAAKYIGYRLGRLHEHMPVSIKRHVSMHAGFWKP